MDTFEVITLIILVLVITIICVLANLLGKEQMKTGELKLKLMEWEGKEMSMKMNSLLLDAKLNESPKINKITENLINLAIDNANEHEATAAALKACKRLHKELGLK